MRVILLPMLPSMRLIQSSALLGSMVQMPAVAPTMNSSLALTGGLTTPWFVVYQDSYVVSAAVSCPRLPPQPQTSLPILKYLTVHSGCVALLLTYSTHFRLLAANSGFGRPTS